MNEYAFKMIEFLASIANSSHSIDIYNNIRRATSKSQIYIIMYHRVAPKHDSWSLGSLSPLSFEKQIIFLQKNYKIISLESLVQSLLLGRVIPKNAAIITFDDGYKDNYLYAYPILKKYNIPATIFLVTGHIGTGNLFWWDKIGYAIYYTNLNQLNLDGIGIFSLRSEKERMNAILKVIEHIKLIPWECANSLINELYSIAEVNYNVDLGKTCIMAWDDVYEMASNGINFGAHTVSHPILTNMSLDQAKWEILHSRNDLEKRISQDITAFSYPCGYFSDDIVDVVRKCGFQYAVDGDRNRRVSPKDSVYQLTRISTVEDFNISKAILCGVLDDIGSIKHKIMANGD